jgi:hypothetical protein
MISSLGHHGVRLGQLILFPAPLKRAAARIGPPAFALIPDPGIPASALYRFKNQSARLRSSSSVFGAFRR